MYLNDVKLMGKVCNDAPLKALANGGAVLNFALVTTENFKDSKGEPTTRKETHRIVAFNNVAKNIAAGGKLLADTEILVEGFLRSHEHNGFPVTEVIARRLQTPAAVW